MLRALYRTYLRAVHRLPHLYLRQFFQIRARDDVDAVAAIAEPLRRKRKWHDVARRVRRLEKATQRDVKAFQRILNLAYGRTGKLRWELLHPMLTDPSMPPPPPIIPALPRTAPPVYPPELTRLLTVPTIKYKKPLTPAELANPRLLPPRADPISPDALLFGPLSKRREANIRKRAYDHALKRVMPPLEVAVRNDQGVSGTATQALDAVRTDVYPRPLGMQDLGVLRDISDVIGNMISIPPPMPRRARRAAALSEAAPSPDQISSEPSIQDHAGQGPSIPNQAPHDQARMHPFRWVRRRYRNLLASIPQLTYTVAHSPGGVRGSFDVTTHALSINPNHKATHYNPPADAVSLAWIVSKSSEGPKEGDLNKDSSSGSKTELRPPSKTKEWQDRNKDTFTRKANPPSHANSNSAAADKETQGNQPSR